MQKKDESSSFEFGCVDETSIDKNVATAEKAPAVPTNQVLVIANKNKDESTSNVGSAGESDVTAKNSLTAAKKKILSYEEPELDNPMTPVTPKEQISGSKTLYVGNLSFAVEQEDVEYFFKAAGEVVNIRFGMNPDETFRGFGYVEFASAEAAEKALHELNGKELLRRPVRLDIAKERRSYAPYSGKDNQFIQEGGRDQGQIIFDQGFNKFDEDKMRSLVARFGSSSEITKDSILKDQDGDVKSNYTETSQMGRREGQRIFVCGFNKFDGEDQIRSSLEEHFCSCGEITRVSIPMDQDGAVKGIALIEFKDNDAFNQALKLDGSKFRGSALSVEEARPRRDTGGSGRGIARGWRSGGWDFGGRSSWRNGDGVFGGNSWSKNYSSYKVDAATDVVVPKKLWEKGNWETEDAIIDEVLNAKRQKLEESTVQAETKPKTPVTPKEQITGSKTLYVGNLSFAVEQEDVENFFKAAGEVVNIRFGMNSDETFRGFGYVEFASAEAVEKALHELNGKELLRRPVKLDIVKERRSYAPYSGTSNDSQFIQKGGRGQGQIIIDHGLNKFDEDKMRSLVERFGSTGETTRVSILKDQDGAVKSTEPSPMGRSDQGQRIFVRGLNKFEGEDQIRSSLEQHFGSCGEITRVSIPMDEDGALKGIALIEFKDSDAFNQALKLDGSKFGGSVLSVEEARTRRDTGGSGLGRGRGWRSGGWDFGGRSSWRSGGGDFGGRSSWRSGGGEDFGGRSSWRSGGGDFGGRSSWRSGGGEDFGGRSSWRSGGGDFGGNSWRSGGWDSSGRSGSRDFSWSKNYFSYEVDAATDVVAPMISFEKGKREAEDAIEDEVLNAKRQKLEVTTVQAETKVVNKVEISNESFDSSSQNQTSLDEGIPAPNEAPTTSNAKKLVVSMQKKDESSSFEFGCDDENSTDKNVVTAKKAPAVPTNEGLVIATKNKDESSSAGEDDTAKNFAKKENVSNNEPELDNLKTPATPKEHITGSKTLYVGNLSFAVEQKDVEHFFKAAGEIVNIRLIMNSDATFRGFGYVEFASAEAAEKALHELNGKELLCRPVRLDIANERRSYAPFSGNDTEPSQMGRRDQEQRIFVRGFNKFDGEDKIRSSLEEHFGSCGEITRVSIPMDQDGSVKGIALIHFKDTDAFNQALKLNGSKFGGSSLSVEEARPRPDTGGSFRGRGRGWRGGGRDSGGRSSWRSGGGDFGGNSWSTGDFGGNSRSNSGGRSSWRSGGGDFGGNSWSTGDFGGNSWSNSGGRSSWRSGGGDFGGNSWSSGDVGGNSWRSVGWDSGGRGGSRDFSWRRPPRGGGGGGGGRGR